MKQKAKIKNKLRVIADDLQILNGKNCIRYNSIPVNLMVLSEPLESGLGDSICIWVKLEEGQYKRIVEQLNKDLREFTLWFRLDLEKIRSFFMQKALFEEDNEGNLKPIEN